MPRQRGLAILLLTVFVDQLGFGIVLPFLPLYADTLGASGFEVGSLLAIYSLMQLVLSAWWGRLSDRIGRRPVLIASAAGLCAGFTVLAFADQLVWMFVGRAILGAFGVGLATAQAWVADTVPVQERGRTIALVGGVGALGFTLGPALGALGVATGGLHLPFFIAAATAGGNVVLAVLLFPASTPVVPAPRARISDLFRARSLVICLAVAFVLSYAFSNIEATFALFTKDALAFTPIDNALFYVFIGLSAALAQVVGTRWLARHLAHHKRVVLGMVLLGVGAALVPAAHSGAQLLGPIALLAAGFGVVSPSLVAWVSASAPAERQGEALGAMQAAGASARIVGPALAGLIFDEVGRAWPFWIAAAVIIATAVATTVAIRSGPPQ